MGSCCKFLPRSCVAEPHHLQAVLSLVICLCSPALKRWYEVHVTLHKLLARLALCGIFIHLLFKPLLSQSLLYISLGFWAISGVSASAILCYQNVNNKYELPWARIYAKKGNTLRLRIKLSRPVTIKAGQHIKLWTYMPFANPLDLFQWHPFTVTSWSDQPQSRLDLLIECRSGITRRLLTEYKGPYESHRALFAGPYGAVAPLGQYEIVLLAASGHGIAQQLPYLKQLIHSYHSRKTITRRVHLVWEVEDLGMYLQVNVS